MNKVVRVVALVGVFALILIALITSSVKPANISENILTPEMTLGDPETAKLHYIVYTDLMCPYCNYYAKSIMDNESEFEQFIADNNILYEVRVTDMLYEGSGVEYSRPAAEAAYCAANENKFWDFYHLALRSIFEDYYDKGIGSSKTAPKISDLTSDYWLDLGKEVGLGETFADCYKNNRSLEKVTNVTFATARQIPSGLPYFSFGEFDTGGFDPTWDWSVTRQMLEMGLKK